MVANCPLSQRTGGLIRGVARDVPLLCAPRAEVDLYPKNVRPRPNPRVLINVSSLVGNPYLDLWNRAVDRSGAIQEPLSWQSALGTREGPAQWVHLQWPERSLRSPRPSRALLGGARLLAATLLARLRGARVLLTAHNTRSHQPRHPALDRLLWSTLPLLVTDLHVMSAAGADEVLTAHPALRRAHRHVIPHGDYGPVSTPVDKLRARTELGLDTQQATVLLTYGALRGYKGIDALLDVFGAARPARTVLALVGKPQDDGLRRRLAALDPVADGVSTELEFVPQDRLDIYLGASDGVVLPYRAVLNSGSLLLALSAPLPVLVPDTPTFREIAHRVGPGWVTCFSGALDAETLASFVLACASPPATPPDLTWCSWDTISELLRSVWALHPGITQ